MIPNAVIHLHNDQPLIADLFELPEPGDVGLRCTNLRSLNGQRPIFADDKASVFFFPYLHIRFVEIPAASAAGNGLPIALPVAAAVAAPAQQAEPDADDELEIDEDFLRRIREV